MFAWRCSGATLLYSASLFFILQLFQPAFAGEAPQKNSFSGRKVFLVDSYHKGYERSDLMLEAIQKKFRGSGISLEVFYMDAKRQSSDKAKKESASRAKELIEKMNPDVLLLGDDDASKYLGMPYYKNSPLPVVFAGVNWDEKEYGYPWTNSTGMLEVDLIEEIINKFVKYAKGPRVAMLTSDTETDRKMGTIYNQRFFAGRMKTLLFSNYKEYKEGFLHLQKESDFIILYNNGGIKGWDDKDAQSFFEKETKVPTFTVNALMASYCFVTIAKDSREFGEFMASAALEILGGKKPSEIPMSVNKGATLMVNMKIADKLGIIIPLSILKTATKIGPSADPQD